MILIGKYKTKAASAVTEIIIVSKCSKALLLVAAPNSKNIDIATVNRKTGMKPNAMHFIT